MSQRKRAGRVWMFFYGRPRRGFPWLIAGTLGPKALLATTAQVTAWLTSALVSR